MNRKLISIVFIGFIIYGIMIFISYNSYALTIDIFNLNVVLSIFIAYSTILDKKIIRKNILYFFLRTLPILVFIIVCISIVPNFTYEESQDIILNNYNKTSESFSINEVSPKRLRVIKSPNLFVKYYYLLSLKSDDEIRYYMFNPVTGVYLETEKPWN